jgi:hypothetical protein
MSENDTPEIDFLKSGDLPKLLRGDLKHKAKIAGSILSGRHRDFTKDAERLAGSMEQAVVVGSENIPLENIPLILAVNHPGIYDVVAGVVNISKAFSSVRQEQGLPKDIHWMVTTKIPPRDINNLYKPLYSLINVGLKMLDHTYKFVTTPQVEGHNTVGRAKSILTAREYLKDKSKSHIVGIFPEGDVETGDSLNSFYDGIGELVRSSESSETKILPVGIFRDDQKLLTIQFGESLPVDPHLPAEEITKSVRNALGAVSHKGV